MRSSVFIFLAMHECLHSVTKQWIATHSLKTADLENYFSHLTVPAVPVLSAWQASAHTWDKNTRTFAESRGASGGRGDPSMPFVKPYCRQQERNLTTLHSFFRNNIKRPPHPPGKTANMCIKGINEQYIDMIFLDLSLFISLHKLLMSSHQTRDHLMCN